MFLAVIILTFAASWLVRVWMTRTYEKWGAVPNAVGANGHQVARHILEGKANRSLYSQSGPHATL